ncbi:hypothetical protein I4U23_008952 [Adineta vaga]|nr:hypothetical protein I4U23_008952 [Adineta vaga]
MSSSLFSRPTSFGDSPAMHTAIDKTKQRHSCGKTIGLIIALVSYILALTLIIGDLFFNSQVFGHVLHRFHAQTHPLVPPKNWIAPIWMTVYGLQTPWLLYAITTLCRRNGGGGDSDYLYKYPRPVPQMQLLTFSLACWSHLLFLFLIQHQSNVLAVIYTVLGAMALTFCLITSIIHLHNYERELSTCHLFGDIWSIRIFVHNGLSVMLAWQIALIGFSSLYACKSFLLSKPNFQISDSTLDLIGVCLIASICVITLVYIILMSCFFFNTMCHVVAGWIFLAIITFSYWQHQDQHSSYLLHISFYLTTALLSFVVCLHLVLAFFRYSGTTWRSLTNSSKNNYRHAILQGKD